MIDDPLKDRDKANRATARRLQDWFSQVAYTRLMPGGVVVIIGNRWCEDDVIGWILREHVSEGWTIVSFPAVAEKDESPSRRGVLNLLN